MKSSKRINIAIWLLLLVGIFAYSCKKEETPPPDNKPESWEIIVYGITECGLCTSFENQLDSENIPYTFYDINTNNEKRAEMMHKLDSVGVASEDIHWPVVDVIVEKVSHMLIQPDLDKDVKPLIGM